MKRQHLRIGIQLAALVLLAPPASAELITLHCTFQGDGVGPPEPDYRTQFTFDTDRLNEGATMAWTCKEDDCQPLGWKSKDISFVSASPQKIVFEHNGVTKTVDRATLKVLSYMVRDNPLGTHTCQRGKSVLPKPQF